MGEALNELLEELEPRQYNLLQEHWTTLRDGLNEYDRPYGSSRDIYESICETRDEPDGLSTYNLGHALAGLANIGVIETYRKRNKATLYNFQDYDQDLLIDVGIELTKRKQVELLG